MTSRDRVFGYTALDEEGRSRSGTLRAPSRQSVASRLRNRGYRPLRIESRASNSRRRLLRGFRPPVGRRERQAFTHQLGLLLESGVPLLRSVRVLEAQTSNRAFAEVLGEVAGDLREGTPFSRALAKHPAAFGDLYVNVIRAGEAAGELPGVLERLATYSENRRALRSRLVNATAYPAVLTVCALMVIVFFLHGLLPTFLRLFRDMEVPLPLPTRMALGASQVLNDWGIGIFGLLVLVLVAVVAGYRTDRGRRVLDGCLLRVPVLGGLVRDAQTVRFARTLGTLLATDVPVLRALSMVRGTLGNRVFRDVLGGARDRVRGGDPLSEPLRESGVFSPLTVHMIAVGERTGNLAEMLDRVADTLETDLKRTLDRLSGLLEPVLILVMGLIVGTIVLAMVLPLFQVARLMG